MRVFLFFIFVNISLPCYSLNFLHYCKTVEQKQITNLEIKKTVDALLELAKTVECEPAYKYLNQLEFLSLSDQEIVDLRPLSGFANLKSLDLSNNNISYLWGVEHLRALEFLYLQNNSIIDITPLSFLEELQVLDLRNNNLKYANAIKDLTNIVYFSVEENPIFASDEEMDYLNSMVFFRKLQKRGLDYSFEEEDLLEIIFNIEQAAERGDLKFFRELLKIQNLRTIVTEHSLFSSLRSKTQKTISAIMFAKDLAYSLRCEFEKLYKGKEHIIRGIFSHLSNMETNIQRFLEYFISEGDFFPYTPNDIRNLEKFLQEKVKREQIYHPAKIHQWCQSWTNKIRESRIPPSLKTGFMGF